LFFGQILVLIGHCNTDDHALTNWFLVDTCNANFSLRRFSFLIKFVVSQLYDMTPLVSKFFQSSTDCLNPFKFYTVTGQVYS
jgi:hypothetical protein